MRPYFLLLALTLPACNPDAGLTKFNPPPEALITAPSVGSAVLEGTALTLRGAASDPNHATGELLARWFVGTVEACAGAAPSNDGTTTCDVVVPGDDAMNVRLEVVDPESATATANATFPVDEDASPTARISSPAADGAYYSDQLLTFRGTVEDAEDDAESLTVWWEDGATRLEQVESTPNGSGEVLGYATLAAGPHALELHVLDSAGNEAVDTVLLNVGPPNSAPDCAITAPLEGSSFALGDTVAFEGSATDPDIAENLLTVAWQSDKDGVLGASTPNSTGRVSFSFADLSADTHVITMTVADELGASCAADVRVQIGTPPTLEVRSPSDGDVVNEGDDLAFNALVSDAEDRASDLRVTWESDLDGLLDTSTPDSTGEAGFLRSDLSWGEHALTVTATDSAGLYAVDRLSFTVNGLATAPVVSLSPSSPYGSDDLLVSIDAPSVDPEGDRLTYSYAWYQNGVLSRASTSATLPASATSRGDRWTVEVWASDGYGESPVASAGVTIGDSLPTIASVTLSPSSARTGDTLTCVASGTSDADGDTVTLGYAWSVNGTTLAETGSTLAGSWFDKGDVVGCSVTPTAGSSTGTTISSAPLTIDNTVPTLTSASISPASPRTGDTLACITTGWSDADGDADGTTYAWTVNGRAAGTGSSLAGGFVGGDVVACVATPSDGEDAGSPVTASVTVGNTSPVLASVSLSPSTPSEGDSLSCTPGSTTDADGTTSFTYTYGWQVNSVGIAATTSTLSSASFDADDVIACVVTPNDGTSSGSAVTSNTVTVANTAPVLTSVSVSPSSPTETDTLTCVTGSTSDADGDVVTLAYTWSVDGIVVAGATGSTLTGASFDRGEDVTCTATPFDGAAYGSTLTAAAVTVGNTAPTITSASISPASPTASSTLTCSYAGYADPDADPENVTYAWTVNGVAAGSSSTLAGSFRGGDVVACVVTPDDGTASGASRSASVTVGNTAPVLASATLSPSTPREGDTLTCTPGYTTDADGTTSFTYSYAWRVNGSSIAATSSTLSSTFFDDGDTVSCVVTPNDGTASGSAVTSSTVTVANTAPVLASVSITPSSPTRSSTLTCTPSGASDADGDVVSYSYRWAVDGVAVGSASTLAGPFSSGAIVICTVTPTDGKDSGAAVTGSATVTNTAPVVTSVTLSPSTVRTNDTLTANVVSSDADGDTVSLTYTWYVNGSVVSGATTSSLSGVTSFSKGDVVYVSVTPSDADGAGTAVASGSVTVANTAPTAPVVAITPSAPETDDPLTCSVATAATDVDGDALTYNFAWDVGGVTYTGASNAAMSSEVPAGEVSYPEVWTCAVTASDGADAGPSLSTNVTIDRACNDGSVAHSASGMDFVEICAGTFDMGCTPVQSSCDSDESPVMPVTLTRAYYMAQTEVTQGQYQTMMGANPSYHSACGGECPVEQVTWHMAAAYANAMSRYESLEECYTCSGSGTSTLCTSMTNVYACSGYRLPTEAEWEGAARCDEDLLYVGSNVISDVSWYSLNGGGRTHVVAGKLANECGLFDMSGNAYEWVQDWYGGATYSGAGATDPLGSTSGTQRVLRGGSWYDGAAYSRTSSRHVYAPANRTSNVGFRLARTVDDDHDGDGYDLSAECDDTNPASYPGAVEACDGADNDCDGTVDDGASCPCTVRSYGGHAYMVCGNGTQRDAAAFCNTHGYDLAVVNDAAENATLNTWGGGGRTWIGLVETTPETFVWSNGDSASYRNWEPRGRYSAQPDPGTGEGCVTIFDSVGLWHDVGCATTATYACEAAP